MRIMKIWWASIILAGLLAAWPLAATPAGPGLQILKEKDRGRTIELQVGQKLILNLRNPASGGYNTNPPLFNKAILELLDQKKLPPEPHARPRVGDFGQFHYEWQAKEKGETEIIINIQRPWEKKPPQEYWRVKVKVE
jgi:predicted secreted protein